MSADPIRVVGDDDLHLGSSGAILLVFSPVVVFPRSGSFSSPSSGWGKNTLEFKLEVLLQVNTSTEINRGRLCGSE